MLQSHTSPTYRLAHSSTPQQDNTQKVDAARRYPGIRIVWLNWLTDSLALWHKQDETPYLLHPPPGADGEEGAAAAVASPPSDAHQISSDPDPDADDWDELLVADSSRAGEGSGDGGGGGDGGGAGAEGEGRALGPLGVEGPPDEEEERIVLDGVDWATTNDEVEEAMYESDDEDEAGSVKSAGGGGMSEDEGSFTDETNSVIR